MGKCTPKRLGQTINISRKNNSVVSINGVASAFREIINQIDGEYLCAYDNTFDIYYQRRPSFRGITSHEILYCDEEYRKCSCIFGGKN